MEWVKSDREISDYYEVIKELKPHLAPPEFLEKVQAQHRFQRLPGIPGSRAVMGHTWTPVSS
jgi:hypothetical protein